MKWLTRCVEAFLYVSVSSAILLWSTATAASVFTFTKIADTSTAVPGGGGIFVGFGPPVISGSNLAFLAAGSASPLGVWADIGGTLGVVADTNTAIPGGSGNFATFVIPSISGSNVAFVGTDTFTNSGIYANVGGTLKVVADTNTAIPGAAAISQVSTDPTSPGATSCSVALTPSSIRAFTPMSTGPSG